MIEGGDHYHVQIRSTTNCMDINAVKDTIILDFPLHLYSGPMKCLCTPLSDDVQLKRTARTRI